MRMESTNMVLADLCVPVCFGLQLLKYDKFIAKSTPVVTKTEGIGRGREQKKSPC